MSSNDFDKKEPEVFDRLPIEDKEVESALYNVVANMGNMMEGKVGREFRECCIEAYENFKNGVSLKKAKDEMRNAILESEKYVALGLRDEDNMEDKKVVKQETLTKFAEATVELVYKIGMKDETKME